MVSQKVKITNPTGLHLRPAGIFSNIANKFECRITFEYENSIANAKQRSLPGDFRVRLPLQMKRQRAHTTN